MQIIKEYLPLLFSMLAITISLITNMFDRTKHKRALRKELTDIIEKLTKLDFESHNLIFGYKEKSEEAEFSKKLAIDKNLNTQRRYLVNHAEYLAGKIPRSITSSDFQIIASSYASIGDLDKAKEFYIKALSKKASDSSIQIAKRGYGRVLYRLGEIHEGASVYRNSVNSCLKEPKYMHQLFTTLTHWGNAELQYSDGHNIPYIFDAIKKTIEKVKSADDREAKEAELKRLQLKFEKNKALYTPK